MKIAFVHPHPSKPHGSERSMFLAAQGVRAEGHTAVLICAEKIAPADAEVYSAVHVDSRLFVDARNRRQWMSREALQASLDFLRAEKVDLLHLHLLPRLKVLESWLREVPTVVTLHLPVCPTGARFWWRQETVCERRSGFGCITQGYRKGDCARIVTGQRFFFPSFVLSILAHKRRVRALTRARSIVVPSHWAKQQVITEGLAEARVAVIPPPVIGLELGPEQSPPTVPTIMFVGRLIKYKGPDHLVRASAKVKTPHQIAFVGDGPMKDELVRLGEELGISERLIFHGLVPPDEVPGYLARAAVVAVTSVWPETFGMGGAEAAASGVLVVGYGAGGVAEWLEPCGGIKVATVDPAALGAALEEALARVARRNDQREERRTAAARFSVQNHVRHTLELYDAIAEPTP